MAKMLFRLPQAKRVIENPTPEEVKELAAKMPTARPTKYGNLNVQTEVLARSKRSTFLVTDEPDGQNQAISRRRARAWAERQDEYIAGREMVVIDGYIGIDPDFRTPARLYVEAANAQHRGHAAAALLRPAARSELRARADRRLHAQPEGGGLPRRPADRGRPRAGRHARLQLRLLRRVEEGRAANVEQARLRPRRPAAARRLQGHPDRRRRQGRPDRRPVGDRQDHDDLHEPERLAAGAGRLRRAGCRTASVYATENGCFAKTFGLNPEDEPTIYGAVTQPDSYLENVSQNGDELDFYDTSYTQNGRATFSFDVIEAAADREIDEAALPPHPQPQRERHPGGREARRAAGRGLLHARRDEGHERPGGADEAGKFLRVPGHEPVLPAAARPAGQPLPRAARAITRSRST